MTYPDQSAAADVPHLKDVRTERGAGERHSHVLAVDPHPTDMSIIASERF